MAADSRVQDMVDRYAAGHSLKTMAQDYKITGDRVRQILAADGRVNSIQARTARRLAKRDRVLSAAMALHADRQLPTRETVAAHLGIPRYEVGEALGPEADRLLVRVGASRQAWTDAECCEALRAAAGALGVSMLSAASYDDYRTGRGDLPSLSLILRRFGTWREANIRAGLTVGAAPARRRSFWTHDQLVGFVAEYLALPETRGTFRDYDDQARARGWPTGSTIKATLGWNRAKVAALTQLHPTQ